MAAGRTTNKTQAHGGSVDEFLATVAPQRAEDARALIAVMERVSGQPATMWGPSIIGFGSQHYVYESGREGDMPRIAFSPRKAELVLYLSSTAPNRPALLAKLGKHKTGKACLYVHNLADVDGDVLDALIADSHAHSLARSPA